MNWAFLTLENQPKPYAMKTERYAIQIYEMHFNVK
jgi:hypothetical protein